MEKEDESSEDLKNTFSWRLLSTTVNWTQAMVSILLHYLSII
jgi:hypothetical protein